jgi:multidrug efflux system membrane fusion protein
MKASRITALGLVAAAGLWIASGHLLPRDSAESHAAIRTPEAAKKPFQVAVVESFAVPHRRKLTISGRTEADKHVTVFARTGGIVTELKIKRGMRVKEGDVIAVLSDDARAAQVAQGESLVIQRRTELEAKRKLIASGALPKLDLVNLEAMLKAAEGALAAAEAERDRGVVLAPWTGVVNEVLVEVGEAAFSFQGREIAKIALDPMLAVVEAAERKLAGIKVGDNAAVRLVTGEVASGRIRFVAKTASPSTRTYRVEVELPNADGAIPDGITAEVSVQLARLERRCRRAQCRRRRHGRLHPGQRDRGRAVADVGRRHSRRRPGDRARPGLRARRPAGRGDRGGRTDGDREVARLPAVRGSRSGGPTWQG